MEKGRFPINKRSIVKQTMHQEILLRKQIAKRHDSLLRSFLFIYLNINSSTQSRTHSFYRKALRIQLHRSISLRNKFAVADIAVVDVIRKNIVSTI